MVTATNSLHPILGAGRFRARRQVLWVHRPSESADHLAAAMLRVDERRAAAGSRGCGNDGALDQSVEQVRQSVFPVTTTIAVYSRL